MEFRDQTQVTEVARRIAALISHDNHGGHLRAFLAASGSVADLNDWFVANSARWLTQHPAEVLLPSATARRLLDPELGVAYRRFLFFAVFEALGDSGWQLDCSQEQVRELAALAGRGA